MAKLKNKEFYTPLFFKAYAIIKLSRAFSECFRETKRYVKKLSVTFRKIICFRNLKRIISELGDINIFDDIRTI